MKARTHALICARPKIGLNVTAGRLPWRRSGSRTGRLVGAQFHAFLDANEGRGWFEKKKKKETERSDDGSCCTNDGCFSDEMDAPPPFRNASTGLKRWCKLTSSSWQPKSGRQGGGAEEVQNRVRRCDAFVVFSRTLPTPSFSAFSLFYIIPDYLFDVVKSASVCFVRQTELH